MNKSMDLDPKSNTGDSGNIVGFGKAGKIVVLLILILIIAVLLKGCFSKKRVAPYNAGLSSNSIKTENAPASSSEPKDRQPEKLEVPAPTTPYASDSDNFTVNFPAEPKVASSTFRSNSAGAIPLTEYFQSFGGGREQAWYKVAIYHYPANYKFSDDFLDKSADTYVSSVSAKYPGTKVANSQKTKFFGNDSISGSLTVPVRKALRSAETIDTTAYALMTVKGQDLYLISVYGTSQENYDAFINSFKFSQ
jgi:hypothetical protein